MIKIIKILCFRAIINKFQKLRKQIELKDIDVSISKDSTKFHFQLNGAIKLAKKININNIDFLNKIKKYIDERTNNKIFDIEITQPGFLNLAIQKNFINTKFKKLLKKKIKTYKKEIIIIDYSSPNIAKDMHVGHLRSTIIGDCLARLLKTIGHKVIKISHLGDWGTQFGMLIAYIKNIYNLTDIKSLKLQKLSELYKEAQQLSEKNQDFKELAKKEVINLHKKNTISLKIWTLINNISKKEYKKIYKLLNVKITYKGESFYNDLLEPLIKKLEKENLIKISNNAKCIYTENFNNKNNTNLPLIVQKSDGGFNYATTDLAALYYRIKYHKANKIIYITDVGQSMHFKMIFEAINKSDINKKMNTKLIHLPIGLMLTQDGKKIKTRSGSSEKLINLLKKSINYSKKILIQKNKKIKPIILKKSAHVLGINTIKYSDLSNNINQNYIFDYKKILQSTGNTASFLNYACVRINSIKNKIKKTLIHENEKINFIEKTEIDLAIHILQYNYTIEKTIKELNPNILTLYLHKLAEKFHTFFHECAVIKSKHQYSRLFLCKTTEKFLKQGMKLLGLKIIKKM